MIKIFCKVKTEIENFDKSFKVEYDIMREKLIAPIFPSLSNSPISRNGSRPITPVELFPIIISLTHFLR